MEATNHRHDINDKVWELLENHICHDNEASGAAFIRGSSVGVEKVFGKSSWKF